ncbi:MAG: hypothetical protein IJ429_02215 [Lachnospiraceae bacterium]|nr:hypothetical protein [Lachnospiraceae bacterium]
MLLQICAVFFHMCLIPYLVGQLVLAGFDKSEKTGVVLKTAAGLMVSYAIYEVVLIGMQLADKGFRMVTYVYCAIVMVLALAGLVLWIRERMRVGFCFGRVKKPDRYMIAAFVLIAVQMAAVLFLATPDEDDAFYSGLSSMSLAYDYLLEYNAYIGRMNIEISSRYMLSGLPIYQASLSLLSGGLHHLVITHNFFPLFYMPLAYALFYEIGKRFLEKEGFERLNGKFLFCLALLHMIGNYYIYSPENFLVTRLWQGKALFVALGVPFLWIFGEMALRKSSKGKQVSFHHKMLLWFLVSCGLLAVSFMGETGLYLGMFMVACLTIASCLVHKSLRVIPWAVISCLPMGLLFVYLIMG